MSNFTPGICNWNELIHSSQQYRSMVFPEFSHMRISTIAIFHLCQLDCYKIILCYLNFLISTENHFSTFTKFVTWCCWLPIYILADLCDLNI